MTKVVPFRKPSLRQAMDTLLSEYGDAAIAERERADTVVFLNGVNALVDTFMLHPTMDETARRYRLQSLVSSIIDRYELKVP